jgi:hypothetical protein
MFILAYSLFLAALGGWTLVENGFISHYEVEYTKT